MARRVSSPRFVGRAAEVEALDGLFAEAIAGRPAVALIEGDAGVGKSRLLAEFAGRAEAAGGLVLRGDCVDLADGELPFAPLVAALRQLMQLLDRDALDAAIEPGRAELARLVPDLREPGTPPATETALGPLGQQRLFERLLGLLRRLGDEQPVALLIEDLHWADGSTRDLISFLVRNLRAERLLLATTHRRDELHRRHPLRPFLRELGRAPVVQRLALEPLREHEVAAQLEGILGHAPSAELLVSVTSRAEGNPFFVEEIASAAEASEGELPDTLRDALMLRIEALDDEAQAVLGAVAVAGHAVDHDLLEAVAGLPDDVLSQALRQAVSHHVLITSPDGFAYDFRHALMREAAYADLLPGRRMRLHRAYARALDARPASGAAAAAELAYHWHAAREPEAALSASLVAAEAATSASAPAEALRHLEHVLELWEHLPDAPQRAGRERVDVVVEAGETAHLAGNEKRGIAFATEAIAEYEQRGDARMVALVRERLSRYLWVSGNGDTSLEVIGLAVDGMPDDAPAGDRARVIAARANFLMMRGPVAESLSLCDEAIRLARAAGDRQVEARALSARGPNLSELGRREEGMASLRRSLELATEVGDVDQICRSALNLADSVDQDGRIEEAYELALQGVATARGLGLGLSFGVMFAAEASHRLYVLGRWDEAEELVRGASGVVDAAVATVMRHQALAIVRLARGHVDEAERLFDLCEREVVRLGGSQFLGPQFTGRVTICLQRGELDAATRLGEAALDALHDESKTFSGAPACAVVARAAADVAERESARGRDATAALALAERAQALLGGLLAVQRDNGEPCFEAAAYEVQIAGELARGQGEAEPVAWWAAVAGFEAIGEQPNAAYARMRLAEALLAGGEREAPATELAAAHAVASAVGAEPLRAQIEALARRSRIALDGADVEGSPTASHGLTPRELEVLALVADGLTNQRIASTLYISQKTASVHVSRILAKLDAGNRTEAGAIAHRLGITRIAP